MATFETLPAGWEVWNEEPGGRAVVVYRPDVFDTDAFPPECLPTIYLTSGPASGRRPRSATDRRRRGAWHVTLYLEPDVEFHESPTFEDRADAVAGAVDLARRFARGDLDLRGCYARPREAYLSRLAELTGE